VRQYALMFFLSLFVLAGGSYLLSPVSTTAEIFPPTRLDGLPEGSFSVKIEQLHFDGVRALPGSSEPEFVFVSFALASEPNRMPIQAPSLAPRRIMVSKVPGDVQVYIFRDSTDAKRIELVIPPGVAWAAAIPEHQLLGGGRS